MSRNKGDLYEQEIVSLLSSNHIEIKNQNRSASDKHSNDVTVRFGQLRVIKANTLSSYSNKEVAIEVKQSPKARMGSGSLDVNINNNNVELINRNDAVDDYVFKDLLIAFKSSQASVLRENIKKFLKRANELRNIRTPVYASLPIPNLPVEIWEKLKAERLVAGVAHKLNADVGAIRHHYQRKNVQYIQIGGLGLFRLFSGVDPLGGAYKDTTGEVLPRQIPLFTPTAQAELRAGRSGANKKNEVTVNYRVEYRISGAYSRSPYSLDSDSDIKLLFGLNK